MMVKYCMPVFIIITISITIHTAEGGIVSNSAYENQFSEFEDKAIVIRHEKKYVYIRKKYEGRWGFDIDVSRTN